MKLNHCFLFVAVAVLFFSTGVDAQNLVTNPGMEEWTIHGAGGPPDGWSYNLGGISATQEATIVRSGDYSACVTWTNTTTVNLQQELSGVTGGNDYIISFWVLDNDTGGRVRLYGYWRNAGGNVGAAVSTSYSVDSPDWQELSTGSLTAPVDATGFSYQIRFYDISGWDGQATIYVDDVSLAQPTGAPQVSEAYSISETDVVVVFDRDVDQASAETVGNYSLSDGVATATFSSAVHGPNNTVTLTGASTTAMMGDTTLDTITVTGVQADGGSPGSNDTEEFYAGISPISNIQQIGLSPGYFVTVRGIIAANDAYSDVWIADAAGGWNGVLMYGIGVLVNDVAVGDDVTVVGKVVEFSSMTEIVDHFLVETHSVGNTPYGPTVITCADLDSSFGADHPTAEPYEGVLVTILDAECLTDQDPAYEALVSDDGIHETVVDDDANYQMDFNMIVGEKYDITGVVMFKGGQYKLCPRDADDIVLKSSVDMWEQY